MLNAVFNERLMYPTYEIIGGEKFMAPSATSYHNRSMGGIYSIIDNYVRQNKAGYVFTDSLDVQFPDGSTYRPDLIVVKKENADIIDWQGVIHGSPDMVVEILSKSTKKNDVTIKKDTYEKFGVKEYWIVDPFIKSVSVYLLRDGKYELDNEYIYYEKDEYDFQNLTDEQKAEVKTEISLSIFPEVKVKLQDIFEIY